MQSHDSLSVLYYFYKPSIHLLFMPSIDFFYLCISSFFLCLHLYLIPAIIIPLYLLVFNHNSSCLTILASSSSLIIPACLMNACCYDMIMQKCFELSFDTSICVTYNIARQFDVPDPHPRLQRRGREYIQYTEPMIRGQTLRDYS